MFHCSEFFVIEKGRSWPWRLWIGFTLLIVACSLWRVGNGGQTQKRLKSKSTNGGGGARNLD